MRHCKNGTSLAQVTCAKSRGGCVSDKPRPHAGRVVYPRYNNTSEESNLYIFLVGGGKLSHGALNRTQGKAPLLEKADLLGALGSVSRKMIKLFAQNFPSALRLVLGKGLPQTIEYIRLNTVGLKLCKYSAVAKAGCTAMNKRFRKSFLGEKFCLLKCVQQTFNVISLFRMRLQLAGQLQAAVLSHGQIFQGSRFETHAWFCHDDCGGVSNANLIGARLPTGGFQMQGSQTHVCISGFDVGDDGR